MLSIPHTSNWDFPLGILMKFAMPIDVNYVGKTSLFKWPYGWLFRWLGGIPVDRKKNTNFVDSMVALYNKYDRLAFAIAPEGTRKG
ncbi:MAG: 1-acyl-sn-glycerol-3-phosphate acyltransferase [Saprospiraceae bacterium]|nr:1-acyl-sn-glycerol-3-phosphate acyltransferase [Saprospiraceae bacterium]